ncbi:hypothetical protein OH77DRAFT_1586231 [Trametes cingulata]|nr:hypothetical protein OH77DRAFT_1586231 [Trametes cingulata]
MDNPSRPTSPDFPPSSQPRPLRQMPQRAPPLQGQTWPRQTTQGARVTPPPQPMPALAEGKLASPPQMGWAKGADKGLPRHLERADSLPTTLMSDGDTSQLTTPTPRMGGLDVALDKESFLAMITANQLVDDTPHELQAFRADALTIQDPLQAIFDNPQPEGWQDIGGETGGTATTATLHDASGRPVRKRPRRDTNETQEDGGDDIDLDLWKADQPMAPMLNPTQPSGDTPPPYEDDTGTLHEPRTRAADQLAMASGEAAEASARGKGKAREDEQRSPVEIEKVLVSLNELNYLRDLARQHPELQARGMRASEAAMATPPSLSRNQARPAQVARPIGIREAMRPLNSRGPSPTNSFPLAVDLNDPEQRRLCREILMSREGMMPWARTTREDTGTAMEVDAPAEQEPGEWTPHHPDDTPPPPPPPPAPAHQTTYAQDQPAQYANATTVPAARETATLTAEAPEPVWATAPTATSASVSNVTTLATTAALDKAHREWSEAVEALGLSEPPMGTFGRFPAVHTRAPTDRMRGIPQEALDEFLRLPRGSRMVLEVYGKAQVDRAEATKITRDIEHVIRTVTKLDVFGLTPPPKPAPGTPQEEAPTAWLLTGITPRATRILANRHGWATRDVAFFAYDQPEPIPTYLFALEGFNQSNADMAAAIVREEFKREPTYNATKSLVTANVSLNKGDPKTATNALLDTIRVQLRYSGTDPDAPALGHVYMDSPTLSVDQWTKWRQNILDKGFSDSFYAYDLHKTNIRCARCHAADHMTDQCQYMHLGDWHGVYTPPPQAPPQPVVALQPAEGGFEEYGMMNARGGRGAYRGYGGGGNRRGSSIRARGGRKFVHAPNFPRGG